MKVRIVETTQTSGEKIYTIQQKHFLFPWIWVPPCDNPYQYGNYIFSTLEEAKANLHRFDGTEPEVRVVFTK